MSKVNIIKQLNSYEIARVLDLQKYLNLALENLAKEYVTIAKEKSKTLPYFQTLTTPNIHDFTPLNIDRKNVEVILENITKFSNHITSNIKIND